MKEEKSRCWHRTPANDIRLEPWLASKWRLATGTLDCRVGRHDEFGRPEPHTSGCYGGGRCDNIECMYVCMYVCGSVYIWSTNLEISTSQSCTSPRLPNNGGLIIRCGHEVAIAISYMASLCMYVRSYECKTFFLLSFLEFWPDN